MIGNLSFDTIFFTDKEDMNSLKLMDFSKAFLVEKKQDFIKRVKLNELDPYQVNTLEKIVLENRYDDHADYERLDNSYLAMKPPEFMVQKDLGLDPEVYYKFDIWAIGIIMHFLLINFHLYEILINKEVETITKMEILEYLIERGVKDKEHVTEIDFDGPTYSHVPYLLKDILKMCLTLDVNKRANINQILEKIEPIIINRGLIKYLKCHS